MQGRTTTYIMALRLHRLSTVTRLYWGPDPGRYPKVLLICSRGQLEGMALKRVHLAINVRWIGRFTRYGRRRPRFEVVSWIAVVFLAVIFGSMTWPGPPASGEALAANMLLSDCVDAPKGALMPNKPK